MEEYFLNWDNYKKKVIYVFNNNNKGGIGDFFKFFMYLLNFCIENNIKMYYLLDTNPLDNFVKLTYDFMYITNNDNNFNNNYIKNINELKNIDEDIIYMIQPFAMHSVPNLYNQLPCYTNNIFYFTEEVKTLALSLTKNNESYISIHIRLGDKYLENGKVCNDDVRYFDENKLFDFIEKHKHRNIFLFCDNYKYKQSLKKMFDFINITNYDIYHTGVNNIPNIYYLNTIVEFYLLSNSEYIYSLAYSGFSIMASKFKNIKIIIEK